MLKVSVSALCMSRFRSGSGPDGDSRDSRRWQRAAEPEPEPEWEPQEVKGFRSVAAVQNWRKKLWHGMYTVQGEFFLTGSPLNFLSTKSLNLRHLEKFLASLGSGTRPNIGKTSQKKVTLACKI